MQRSGWLNTELETIPDVLTSQAERWGSKAALYFDDEAVSYGELEERSNAVANQLQSLGVSHGDTVAIIMENCAEMVYAWFGAVKLGAIEVPINVDYKGDFLRYQLDNCGARVVIVDSRGYRQVAEVLAGLPDVQALIVLQDDGTPESLTGPESSAASRVRAEPYRFLLEGSTELPKQDVRPTGSDPCGIIYTAGTTGPSKGAVLSHQYLLKGMGATFSELWQPGPEDVMYSPLPLFHGNAMAITVLSSIVTGGTGVLDRRFSVSRTWDRVRQHNATGISILGSMLAMLWKLPEDPRDAELPLRAMICAPVPAEIHHAIERRYQLRICMGYGMTEAAPIIVGGIHDEIIPGSSGKASPRFDVRIFDDNDMEVEPGKSGEIVFRPLEPWVMFDGYYRNSDATMAQSRNLWFHTGDLGKFDEDGNFYFVDRKKDAMRRRGENISSFEVERAVLAHPLVRECAAHAVPSEFSEDDVKICVVVEPGEALSEVDLMDHCVGNMPYFAVPRYIEFLEELPKNQVGRVLKYQLRERCLTDATWDREAAGYEVRR